MTGLENRYRSLFSAGRGGMGSVEVALERGAESLGRVVALKRLLPDGARNPRHKEMFLREAQLAARLIHPNVVHAFTFGELDGELFMAMEYVEGQPLSQVLAAARAQREALDPALVAGILAEVCDGLHAAHELRDPGGRPLHVVHRDVSPQNVMVAYAGHAKVLDFGVAKFEMVSSGSHTRTGEVKGKMAYMSPEQALGEPLDRRTDLFSVGAVLFECLAGHRMWGAGTDLDVMRKLALEDAPRLDLAVPGVPPALAQLQARLVARDRAARPATAHDVATELRAIAGPGGSSVDARHAAVRALMQALFTGEEAARDAQLAEALERATRPDAEPPSGKLDPLAASSDRAWAPPVVTAPGSTSAVGSSTAAPWRARVGWVLALALCALAARVVLRPVAREPERHEVAAPAPAPPPAPSAEVTRETAIAPALAPAMAPASATHAPHALAPPASRPQTTRLRPPDVDPSPF
jgi:hypothetical protein